MKTVGSLLQVIVGVVIVGVLAVALGAVFQGRSGMGQVGATSQPYPPYPGSETLPPSQTMPPLETPIPSPTSQPFYLPPNGERIVYVASSPETVAYDLPISSEELVAKGLTLTYSVDELWSMFEAGETSPQAIILHNSRADEIDQSRIQNLYAQGVIVAGVNLTKYNLATLVGDNHEFFQKPDWMQGIETTELFQGFSIIAMDSPSGLLCSSPEMEERSQSGETISCGYMASSDRLRVPSDVDLFLSIIRKDIADIQRSR